MQNGNVHLKRISSQSFGYEFHPKKFYIKCIFIPFLTDFSRCPVPGAKKFLVRKTSLYENGHNFFSVYYINIPSPYKSCANTLALIWSLYELKMLTQSKDMAEKQIPSRTWYISLHMVLCKTCGKDIKFCEASPQCLGFKISVTCECGISYIFLISILLNLQYSDRHIGSAILNFLTLSPDFHITCHDT